MKKIPKVLVALSIVALATHCGDDDEVACSAQCLQAERLLNTWGFNSDNSTLIDGDWSGFELAIPTASENGGTFQISGAPTGFEAVWNNGEDSWNFVDDNADLITRESDAIEITINQVDETNLRISFTVAVQGGRTAGIDGEWTFEFNSIEVGI